MAINCKGRCIAIRGLIAKKPIGGRRYAAGQKRCDICYIFVWWDGMWCPCCSAQLRTRPRATKYKAAMLASG